MGGGFARKLFKMFAYNDLHTHTYTHISEEYVGQVAKERNFILGCVHHLQEAYSTPGSIKVDLYILRPLDLLGA